MANSTVITDYIAHGLAAARPVTPPVGSGVLALWFSTDTSELDGWSGSAWVNLVGSGSGSVTSVATGAGLSGGPITTSGTLVAAYQAGTLTTFNTGLTLAAGTLTPDWGGGLVSALGTGITLTAGTLTSAGSGGSVTSVSAGAGLSGGPITTSGTLVAAYQAGTLTAFHPGLTLTLGTLIPDWNGGTVTTLGAGVSVVGGTLNATGTAVATTIVAGANLTGGTISTSGTVAIQASPTFVASSSIVMNGNTAFAAGPTGSLLQLVQADAGSAVLDLDSYGTVAPGKLIARTARGTQGTPAAVQLGDLLFQFIGQGYQTAFATAGGLNLMAFENWTTTAHGGGWQIRAVTQGTTSQATVMQLLSDSSGVHVEIGSTTTLTTGEALQVTGSTATDNLRVSGTLSAFPLASGLVLSAGSVAVNVGLGLAINSGTIIQEGSLTIAGTAAATSTINPGSGTRWVDLTMPSTGGTVTLAAAPAFAHQECLLSINQGATAGAIVLNSGFVFGASGGPTAFTVTATASVKDRLRLISPDGTHWGVFAANQGWTI